MCHAACEYACSDTRVCDSCSAATREMAEEAALKLGVSVAAEASRKEGTAPHDREPAHYPTDASGQMRLDYSVRSCPPARAMPPWRARAHACMHSGL